MANGMGFTGKGMKVNFFANRKRRDEKEIRKDTIDTYTRMLVDMLRRGYVKFHNPKTKEEIDVQKAIKMYQEELAKEMLDI